MDTSSLVEKSEDGPAQQSVESTAERGHATKQGIYARGRRITKSSVARAFLLRARNEGKNDNGAIDIGVSADSDAIPDSLSESVPPQSNSSTMTVVGHKEQQHGRIFREEAKVWHLYISEAEELAKERAILLNTSLDSLLIFSGLFAGVVASFMIDARRDLQEDSEQRSLAALRKQFVNETAIEYSSFGSRTVPPSAPWTSGLWALSLFLTLFSAVLGVLAKVWLAKYFPASSLSRGASDAYARYTLDMQADRWHLEKVLLLIPLLVQIALGIFLAGLTVQSYNHYSALGIALSILCGLGLCIYVVTTVLPLIPVVSSPFRTTLTELFTSASRHAVMPGPFKKDRDEALGDIFYFGVVKSPNPSNVDEAIQELAVHIDHHSLLDKLCKNDTAAIILKRLQQWTTTKFNDIDRNTRIHNLSNELLALLKLLRRYEEHWTEGQNSVSVLRDILRSADGHQHPRGDDKETSLVHLWNKLPDPLQPLEFVVQMHISKIIGQSGLNGGVRLSDTFQVAELETHAWDLALKEPLPSHRLEIILGTCRGLVQGQVPFQVTSALLLSVRLSKVAALKYTCRWARDMKQSGEYRSLEARALVSKYLTKLYDANVQSWLVVAYQAMSNGLQTGSGPFIHSNQLVNSVVIEWICSPFLHPTSRGVNLGHAITMLNHLSLQEHTLSSTFYRSVDSHLIQRFVTTIMHAPGNLLDDSVRGVLVCNMASCLREADVCARIDLPVPQDFDALPSIPGTFFSGLLEEYTRCIESQVLLGLSVTAKKAHHLRTISLLQYFASRNPTKDPFTRIILLASIPQLVSLAFRGNTRPNHALELLRSGPFEQSVLRKKIVEAIVTYVKSNISRLDVLVSFGRLFNTRGEENQFRIPDVAGTPRILRRNLVNHTLKTIITNMLGASAAGAQHTEIQDASITLLRSIASCTDLQGIATYAVLKPCFARSIALEGCNILTILRSHANLREGNCQLIRSIVDGLFPGDSHMSSQSEALFELLKLTSTLCLEGLLRSSATWNSLRNSILQRGPLQIDAWISGALGGRLGLSNVGPDSISVLRKWIAILGSVAHNVDFPEAVHWLLETLMNADDPSVIGDILKFLIDPTGDEMTDAVLTAANSTTVFGKTVEDFEVTACLLQSFSDSEEHGANGCSEGSMLDDGDALDSFLNSCLISRPVRTKLYHMNDEERSRWLRAIAVAVHHNTGDFDLAQTVNVVAQMAVHHPGLRDSALLSLAIFTESQSTRIHVWKDVQAILNEVLGSHGLSKVGTSCACRLVWSLISQRDDLSSASNVKNPENLIDQAFIAFITRGFKEVDCPWYGTREFVELLCNLDRDGCYDVVITEAVETCFTNEIDNHETRDLWCKLSAPRMKDAHFVGMEAILDSAMTDGQLPGRFQDAITRILEDEQTRTPMLQMLVQRIVDAVRINEEGPGIVSCSHTPLLNLARTIPEDGDVIDERIGALEMIIPILPVEDDAYKSLVLAITEDGLGQWKFAAKDPGTSSRTRKGPDTRTLSMVLSSTISGLFYSGADGMCTMAMKLLLTVVKGRHLLELLQEKEDRELVQRLVDRAVASSNPSIRQGALDVCQSMSLSARFQDVVKSCLTVTIETATEDPHVVKSSEGLKIPGILRVLADLLEGHDTGGHGRCQYTDLFFRIISPSTWHLASIALLAVERAQNDLKNKSQVAQLDTSPAPPDKRRIDEHLVRMIPSILPTMSVGQKRIALDLIEELTLSMPVVHDVVQALHPLLDSNSTLSVRGDAVELMLELHIKYRSREMGSLSYVIPSLIILALDDAGDAGGSRAMALQLLVSLMTQDDKGREAVKGHQRKHAFQTTKFMALLGYRDLRSSLVELLSLMAVDATIRKTISLQVMTVLSSTVEDENYAGHAELLTRMISDKRFADAPIDYVTILFSSAMSSRSSFTTHRYQLVTSLWCHYSTNPFKGASTGTEKEVKGLVEYFVATLFGRHATKAEVDTWIANSERWLKDCVTQGKD